MAHAIKFDPVNYIQGARKHGFTQEQSEFNAQQLEIIIEQQNQTIEKKSLESENRFEKNILTKELPTKLDIQEAKAEIQQVKSELKTKIQKEIKSLEVKIEQYPYNTLKLIVWTGIGFTATLLSTLGDMIAKGFHWW